MKTKILISVLFLIINIISAQVTPTNEWVSFYSSNSTFDSNPLSVGDVIEVFDPDGVLCGKYTVETSGAYGFLHVYRDDFTTSSIDEGAEPGDSLTFTINKKYTLTVGPSEPVWDSFGETVELDLVSFSNWQPIVENIPDQTILEGESFATINLENFVSDIDNIESELIWSYAENIDLSVTITGSLCLITIPNEDWNGSETITFRATDPGGLSSEDKVNFTVIPVNDAPSIKDIPDQSIDEGSNFDLIELDQFTEDIDNDFSELKWSYSGNNQLIVGINDKIASVTVPDENWNGSETITFTVSDLEGLSSSEEVIFTINAVNDPPDLMKIPDQEIDEGGDFALISLDEFVEDIDNSDEEIYWNIKGNKDLLVSIDINRILKVEPPDTNWYGTETLICTAVDLFNQADSFETKFTINPINDAPEFISVLDSQTVSCELVDSIPITKIQFRYEAIDIENDKLIYTAISIPDNAEFTEEGLLTWAPNQLHVGKEFEIIVEVSDGDLDARTIALVKVDSTVTDIEDFTGIPFEQSLKQNYPNPFNPSTIIEYSITEPHITSLVVYNILGKEITTIVKKEYQSAGIYRFNFDAIDLPSGIYIYRISSGDFIESKKMILLK